MANRASAGTTEETCKASIEWYMQRFNDAEYYVRCEYIIANGLPVILNFTTGDFAAINLTPCDGFVDLANPNAIQLEMEKGWQYHISVTRRSAMSAGDAALWDELR